MCEHVSVSMCVSHSSPFTFFVLFVCLVLFHLACFCLTLFYYIFIFQMPFFFLIRERKGVNLGGTGGGEEVGEVRGRENTIRVYCMEKNLFSN